MYQMISLLSSIFPHGFSSLSEKQNPDKIWPITSLISSLTFCPLIYSVPTILVALLFRERHGTLPQRSFILAVSSIWNALSQISTRKLLFLSFFFFSFCVCVCVYEEGSLFPSGLCSDITFSVRPSLTCYFRS